MNLSLLLPFACGNVRYETFKAIAQATNKTVIIPVTLCKHGESAYFFGTKLRTYQR